MTTFITLEDSVPGRYEVITASGSRYVIDLHRMRLRRLPPVGGWADRTLRRDGAEISLLEVVACTVGREMVLLVDLCVPGVIATTRRTTPVMSIEPLLPIAEESL